MNKFDNKQKFEQKLNKTQMSIKKEAKINIPYLKMKNLKDKCIMN